MRPSSHSARDRIAGYRDPRPQPRATSATKEPATASPDDDRLGALEILDGVDLAPIAVDKHRRHGHPTVDQVIEQIGEIRNLKPRRSPIWLTIELLFAGMVALAHLGCGTA